MQLSNFTAGLLLLTTLLGGSTLILKQKVDTLKQDVEEITKIANDNADAMKDLKTQYSNIEIMQYKNNEMIRQLESENEKLRKDAKKANVVAAKPRLVEKQINKSFNKFAEDIQGLSR